MLGLKFAAVDIGSNAIRFQITQVTKYEGETYFKRLEYVRFPLRLGQDVFQFKAIKSELEAKFLKLMHAFKLLIDLYEVDEYYACATSAMREAKNGSDLCRKTLQLYGLKINIISGEEEAELINAAVTKQLRTGNYLLIDVGGGSTEFNIIIKGKRVNSKSFKLGSVRNLNEKYKQLAFDEMEKWLIENTSKFKEPLIAVGTGGNINKLYELAKSTSKARKLLLSSLEEVQHQLRSLSTEEKIYKLHLNPDRADVILPASDIYKKAMSSINAQHILVPDVGLKDGIMLMLYEQHLGENFDLFQ